MLRNDFTKPPQRRRLPKFPIDIEQHANIGFIGSDRRTRAHIPDHLRYGIANRRSAARTQPQNRIESALMRSGFQSLERVDMGDLLKPPS